MTTREACVGRSSGAWPMAEPAQLGLQMEAEEVMVVMVDATPCAARFVDGCFAGLPSATGPTPTVNHASTPWHQSGLLVGSGVDDDG